MEIESDAELNRYTIARGDLLEAWECLTACGGHPDNSIEYSALLKTAIIAYSRPFSNNERQEATHVISRLKIEWFSDLNADQTILHEKIIEARNKTIAHAESTRYHARFDRRTRVLGSSRPHVYFGQFSIPKMKDLVSALIATCHLKSADYVNRVSD